MWTDSRIRLYRDPANGMLAGVCAGIAAYFGIDRIVVRLAFVLAFFLFFFLAVIAYVVLAIALPRRPAALFDSPDEEAFWHGLATAPDDALAGIRRRFSDLETRLRGIERHVASPDFDLHRQFRDL
ncbi:MAG: envelope stress response membrane protein PspC [Stellaceae bacterium]